MSFALYQPRDEMTRGGSQRINAEREATGKREAVRKLGEKANRKARRRSAVWFAVLVLVSSVTVFAAVFAVATFVSYV